MHVDQSSTADAKQFEDILHSFGLAQHVDSSTHICGHTMDLILSRSSDSLVHSCVVSDLISDHHAVYAMIKSGNPHRPQKTVTYRKLRSIDSEVFQTDFHDKISSIDLSTQSVDEAVDFYNSTL